MSLYKRPRRHFLLHALAACGASLVAPSAYAYGRQAEVRADASRSRRIAARYLAGDPAAARTIGEAYLRHLALDSGVASIMSAASRAVAVMGGGLAEATAVTALVEAVRRDFREQRTIELEGWILSRTELELCLLTLLPDRE